MSQAGMGSLPITFLFASFFIGLEDAELSSFRVSLLGANFLAERLWMQTVGCTQATLGDGSPMDRSRSSTARNTSSNLLRCVETSRENTGCVVMRGCAPPLQPDETG